MFHIRSESFQIYTLFIFLILPIINLIDVLNVSFLKGSGVMLRKENLSFIEISIEYVQS